MMRLPEASMREAYHRMVRRYRDALELERARGISRTDAQIDDIARREATRALDRMLLQWSFGAADRAARRGLAL